MEPVKHYTVREVARMFGISETTIYKMIRDGKFIEPVILNKRKLYPSTALEEWSRRKGLIVD